MDGVELYCFIWVFVHFTFTMIVATNVYHHHHHHHWHPDILYTYIINNIQQALFGDEDLSIYSAAILNTKILCTRFSFCIFLLIFRLERASLIPNGFDFIFFLLLLIIFHYSYQFMCMCVHVHMHVHVRVFDYYIAATCCSRYSYIYQSKAEEWLQ